MKVLGKLHSKIHPSQIVAYKDLINVGRCWGMVVGRKELVAHAHKSLEDAQWSSQLSSFRLLSSIQMEKSDKLEFAGKESLLAWNGRGAGMDLEYFRSTRIKRNEC